MFMVPTKNRIYVAMIVFCVVFTIRKCCCEKMKYFSMERPRVYWFDRDYYSSVIFKSKLVSRIDPVHYVTVNYTSKKIMDNDFMISFYVYELLSNVYKRSFVELHLKFCDFFESDDIVGEAMRSSYYRTPEKERLLTVLKCPLPPGLYSFLNLTFAMTPLAKTFPIEEGRVYINVTHRGLPTGRGSIDLHWKT